MSFAAHAQKMKVEAVRRKCCNRARVCLNGIRHVPTVKAVAVDVGLRDVNVRQKRLAGLTLVGIRVRNGYVALITEEDVHA